MRNKKLFIVLLLIILSMGLFFSGCSKEAKKKKENEIFVSQVEELQDNLKRLNEEASDFLDKEKEFQELEDAVEKHKEIREEYESLLEEEP